MLFRSQVRAGKHVERGLVTSGDDLDGVRAFLPEGGLDYSAADVIGALTVTAPATR